MYFLAIARPPTAAPAPVEDFSRRYTVAIYESPADVALRTDTTERGAAYWKSWADYHASLAAAGVLRGGMPLQTPDHARHIRLRDRDGKTLVTEGPFAKSEPPLTGYFILECDSLQAATEFAARAPLTPTTVVEVRPAYPAVMPAAH